MIWVIRQKHTNSIEMDDNGRIYAFGEESKAWEMFLQIPDEHRSRYEVSQVRIVF